MKYICFNRFKDLAITGKVNIPANTECESIDGFITANGNAICCEHSENGHKYFAINEDGRGMERGKLTHEIQYILSKRDKAYQKRWDKIWADSLCLSLKNPQHEDFFLWGNNFYTAPIEDLMYILNLIKGV